MDLWTLLVILAVLGFCAWALQKGWLPIGEPFRQLIIVVLVVVGLVAVLNFFGIVGYLKSMHM